MSGTKLLSAGQAAKRLGVKSVTVRLYCATKQLHATRSPGGHYRISIADCDAFALRKLASLRSRLAA